jgi:hypothetical protein
MEDREISSLNNSHFKGRGLMIVNDWEDEAQEKSRER